MGIISKWKSGKPTQETEGRPASTSNSLEESKPSRKRWNLGVLAADTDEVPGSVILLSKPYNHNEPLGLQHSHARTSTSSLPSPYGPPSRGNSISHGSRQSSRSRSKRSERKAEKKAEKEEKKRSKNGKFILDPQPDDSANDPLNWPAIRRDAALLSLGFFCMVGGGMTPILAAGFNQVAETYNVTVPKVALTTGLYMLGMGLGSVVASPTAILWGKRPVYLCAIVIFLLSSIWCALSPNYISLLLARIVQGFAISPVECLPSATVAEIFFLHERAYRLGVYTLLLLGGKNLIPLVSAAIIQSKGWRWVFWIVAIVVGFCFILIFLFVPETFWDRTPRPRGRSMRSRSHSPSAHRQRFPRRSRSAQPKRPLTAQESGGVQQDVPAPTSPMQEPQSPQFLHSPAARHARFADDIGDDPSQPTRAAASPAGLPSPMSGHSEGYFPTVIEAQNDPEKPTTAMHDRQSDRHITIAPELHRAHSDVEKHIGTPSGLPTPNSSHLSLDQLSIQYTDYYRSAPPKSYVQSLKPWNGRLAKDKWIRVMIRPFILMAYPAVLWSSLVYALGVGWLIVLSESVSHIFQTRDSYNFTSLQVGLIYISPFIGGVLGTAVAGKFSDVIVRYMARKNDGVYEPEFRLVMSIPIALATTIGLMGFGWSAEEKDNWIVPTIFFGIISFGCTLATTTAITFCVDSYRMYAGEALVTLNFCKNVLHGFVFSLFFTNWLEHEGAKNVFLAVGGIQLGCMFFSIPMYIYGKRARMWTVRKKLMEKF